MIKNKIFFLIIYLDFSYPPFKIVTSQNCQFHTVSKYRVRVSQCDIWNVYGGAVVIGRKSGVYNIAIIATKINLKCTIRTVLATNIS